MSYVVIQGCPVPRKLAPFLLTILRESGATLQSCYRGADAERLLHKLHKHSQRELYDGFVNRRPGFLPANAPGHSTHELRNDGVAYPHLPDRAKLKWWQVGIDIDDAHVAAFIRAAARHGWKVVHRYKTASEHHHVNFGKPPLRHRIRATVRGH